MRLADHVAAVTINYQTPDLLEAAVRSFHQAYPTVPLLVIDNGSQDHSPELVRTLADELGDVVEPMLLEENVYHGPAMDRALRHLQAPYVYVFDSDTVTHRPGFLEPMQEALAAEPRRYVAGQIVTANRRGFRADDESEGIPVPASAFMLIKRAHYLALPPFIHHGLPVLKNCIAAQEAGYEMVDFPVEEYVEHLGRGTAERYGYGLGLKSRLDFVLNKLGL